MLFSMLTMNPQPLHIDAHFAAGTEFGRPLVNSLFTLGLMIGMSVNDTTLGTTIANLGMSDVEFPKPVFQGDTVRVRDRSRQQAGEQIASERGYRRIPPPGHQSGWRGGRVVLAHGIHAQATGLSG